MTALTLKRAPPVFPLLLIFAAVVVMATVTQLNFHSLLKHGDDGDLCRNGREEFRGFTQDGKLVIVCRVEPFKYGLQFLIKNSDGTFREVTSFIFRKSRGATLKQVKAYLLRQGVTIP